MKVIRTISILTAPVVLSGMVSAAAPTGRLFEPGREWLERYDPTLISSRYLGEFSYESYDDDSDFWKFENTMRWGIPLRDGHALGFQFILPVKWSETATDDAFGLGDLELAALLVWGLENQYAWSVGIEVPLASESFEFKLATGLTWYF